MTRRNYLEVLSLRYPKISPKIPDTPGKFIMKWEGIQQKTGLHLTQALREYWIGRSDKLSEELDPIKNKARLETSPAQWTKQDTRNNRQHLQRNHSGTEEEEEYHQNRSRHSSSTSTEKTKHQRRFERTLTHNNINLSIYQLTPGEISLLSKGLNFIPTPNKEHPAKHLQDILLFDRKLGLKYYFYNDTTTETTELTEDDNTHNDILHPSSGWTPPSGQDPFLESYRSTIIHNTLKEIKRKNSRKFKRNLKKEGWKAITTLRNNKDIVIKPSDKGGNVIMNKQDYLQERLKQISNRNHYEILEDPT